MASWCTATSAGVPAPSTKTSRTRWPGALGAIMLTSTSAGGDDLPVADVKAVGKHEGLAGLEVRRNLLAVDLGLRR